MALYRRDDIIYDCSYTDFKVLDGMIIYLPNRSLRLRDDSIVKYHENFLRLVDKKVNIRVINDYIFEFEGGTDGLKKFIRELQIAKANKLASAYTQIALKEVSQYVEKYYAIYIPKSDIDYEVTSVIFKTENCDLFYLGHFDPFSYGKNGVPDFDEDEDEDGEYSEPLLEDIMRTQAIYNVDLSSHINLILDSLKEEIARKIESLKESEELDVSVKGIITTHNFRILMKYDDSDCVLLYPNSVDYDIFLKGGDYEWAYLGDDCCYYCHSVLKYHKSYRGPRLPGDIVVFNDLVLNECMDKMDRLLDFSEYKNYKGEKQYLPIYWLNYPFYFTDDIKRQLKSFNDKDWDIYLTIDSLDYLSDENVYCSDFWLYKKYEADLYILVSKKTDVRGRYCIVVHPTIRKYADYYIYVNKDKKELALCFLTYYFNSAIPNKRQTFTGFSYSLLSSFGIVYWEKK